MSIEELYKLHINPNALVTEIILFLSSYDLCIYIKHPDPVCEKINQAYRLRRENLAKEWILKNSKLKIE